MFAVIKKRVTSLKNVLASAQLSIQRIKQVPIRIAKEYKFGAFFLLIMALLGFNDHLQAEAISTPLSVHAGNPRYFSDSDGKAIYLTGSHTWDNFLDWGGGRPNFDYSTYLKFLQDNGHNFIRLWVGTPRLEPNGEIFRSHQTPWQRPGPGIAKDGQPKFDLTQFNEDYFLRLRARIVEAGKRSVYVSVMLFNGLYDWEVHPFHPSNNINKIDGDRVKIGFGEEIFRLNNPAVLTVQKNYIRKVIDTVNDLDNVLYEVGNEIKGHSVDWQYHIIDFIHQCEKSKPKRHPVGMTGGGEGLRNIDLFNSPADWISPRVEPGQDYSSDPPAATGGKVIINDTDHLAGVLENPTAGWVWKSFLRGLNPILMDVLQNRSPGYEQKWNLPNRPGLAETRQAMGQTRTYAKRLDLAEMTPAGELVSTQYCLANLGNEYLIYLPFSENRGIDKIFKRLGITSSKITINLSNIKGTFRSEWFNPKENAVIDGDEIIGGETKSLKVPFSGDAVLYLYREP